MMCVSLLDLADHERVAQIIEEQTKSIQANSDSDELAGLTSSISSSSNPMDHCAMLDRQNKVRQRVESIKQRGRECNSMQPNPMQFNATQSNAIQLHWIGLH